jgi:hypothetical protein
MDWGRIRQFARKWMNARTWRDLAARAAATLRRVWPVVVDAGRARASRLWGMRGQAWPALVMGARSILQALWWLLHLVWRGLALTAKTAVIVVLVIAGLQIFVVTGRDVAYRYRTPDLPGCKDPTPEAKRVLAGAADNDELKAIAADTTGNVRDALRCMLQEHEIPVDPNARWPNGQPMGDVRYRLAFLEFTQDGRPAELDANKQELQAGQLDALLRVIRQEREDEHYVIAFIHGWRHDARLGDGNVAALRTYAAHVASFLDYRCKMAGRNCGAKVTGVYVGWRGARIDEHSPLGALFDTKVGTVLAAATLFDRKPVSERVAPAAIATLKELAKLLDELGRARGATAINKNKMITIGHSLGGNMLAVALKDPMVERVRRHRPDRLMKAPFGDLIVLINPASEASNWTAIQRAMRERVVFEPTGEELNEAEFVEQLMAGHRLFKRDQPPIYISLTSAYAWPAGGIRHTDLALATSDAAKRKMQSYRRQASYDWATHDAFPLFKADLRPLAETLERNADLAAEAGGSRKEVCDNDVCQQRRSLQFLTCSSLSECLLRATAAAARNFPFMNTNSEETLTIGHYNPVRPPYGTLTSRRAPATVYGTTHEFVVNQKPEPDDSNYQTRYTHAAAPDTAECAIVDHWLWKARKLAIPNDSGWDSGYSRGGSDRPGNPANLTPVRPRTQTQGRHLESQFVHGYNDGGMSPISRGRDPFWNMRAYDTALKEHDGFVFYPLICAINQLVMDRVAAEPPAE